MLILYILLSFNTLDSPSSIKQPLLNKFLKQIAKKESSGGVNLNHKLITSGIHAGDRAVGAFGLMPNTVKDLYNRKLLKKSKTYSEKEIAETLANFVLQKCNWRFRCAAYLWHHGHNIPIHKVNVYSDYSKGFKR